MHKIFGRREDVGYWDREGAYFIPCCNGMVAVVQTEKGYFFLGGGLKNGESHLACIKRECIEESGYVPHIKAKVCSAEAFMKPPEIGYFHPIQTYYCGELWEKVSTPTEKGHVLFWVAYDQLKGKMCLQMQNWALEQLSLYVK